MAINDTLANALSMIPQYERLGKKELLIKPMSKIMKQVLDVLNKEGYTGTYEQIGDGRGGYLKLNLIGNVNNCGVIKPRYPVTLTEYETREKQFLPAKGMGILVVSTNQGIMTHAEAQSKKLGGVLLAYCY